MENKKHIVILSYYFPPHSNVGGRRLYFFAKYLAELGYKITVITADLPLRENWTWDADLSFAEIIKLKHDSNPEEYSSKQSFFNFIFWRLNNTRYRLLKRVAWKIGELYLPQNFNIRLKFNENQIAKKLYSVNYIIATGGPWLMFEYGVRLKDVTQSKLVLDYRDPWNAIVKEVFLDSLNNKGVLSSYLNKKSIKAERNSLKNADLVISVSKPISENCNKLLGKKETITIYNGFDLNENTLNPLPSDNKFFNITFSGHLRKEQDTETLIKGLLLLIKNNPEIKPKLRVNFIGSKVSPENVIKKIEHSELKNIINITSFLPKKEAMEYLSSSQLLLQFSFKDKKGIVSSKLIQYLGINKPILLVSNNDDIMEKIILETQTGNISKTPNDVSSFILKSFIEWKKNNKITFSPNVNAVNFYSFKHQVNMFEKVLDNI